MALSEIVKELLFLRQAQAFIMPTLKSYLIDIMQDNPGTIKMTNNKHSSKRTRHIDVNHHIIHDAVDAGRVLITYVKIEGQHADVLTKALEQALSSFKKHRSALMNVV